MELPYFLQAPAPAPTGVDKTAPAPGAQKKAASAPQHCTDRFSKPKIKFILFLVFAESTLPTYSRHEKKSR